MPSPIESRSRTSCRRCLGTPSPLNMTATVRSAPMPRSGSYLPAAVPDVSAGNPSDILWVVSTARRSALAVVAALFAGLVVGVLALPSSGVDTYPPVCWAWGGYEVPCDSGPSYFFVFAAAGITAIGTWYLTRSRSHA